MSYVQDIARDTLKSAYGDLIKARRNPAAPKPSL
jgi:hypothetical protein